MLPRCINRKTKWDAMVKRGKSLKRWFYEVIALIDRDQITSKKEKYKALLELCLDIVETHDIRFPSEHIEVLRLSREHKDVMKVNELGFWLSDGIEEELTEEKQKDFEECDTNPEIQLRLTRAYAIENNRRKKETCKRKRTQQYF